VAIRNESIRLLDVQQLVRFVLADGIRPTWANVKVRRGWAKGWKGRRGVGRGLQRWTWCESTEHASLVRAAPPTLDPRPHHRRTDR